MNYSVRLYVYFFVLPLLVAGSVVPVHAQDNGASLSVGEINTDQGILKQVTDNNGPAYNVLQADLSGEGMEMSPGAAQALADGLENGDYTIEDITKGLTNNIAEGKFTLEPPDEAVIDENAQDEKAERSAATVKEKDEETGTVTRSGKYRYRRPGKDPLDGAHRPERLFRNVD